MWWWEHLICDFWGHTLADPGPWVSGGSLFKNNNNNYYCLTYENKDKYQNQMQWVEMGMKCPNK